IDPLRSLYDRIPAGGYVIVDDYHVVEASRIALHDFLSARGETPTLQEIDGVGVYFRKETAAPEADTQPKASWDGVFNA
ncbi:MAG: TylF/MycF family methyltransferase, partial [Rhodobacterales bacterium]|nr:TylF/MycF family methyltransferase [Rhodobacterales bacterium]